MSLMIAQSAFLCSLFDTVCSASNGPPLAVAEAGPVGLTASFAVFASDFDFSSCLVLFAPARRLSCVGALMRKRGGTILEVLSLAIAEDGGFGLYCASMIPSQAARATGWLT
jgi:hypothetical protein